MGDLPLGKPYMLAVMRDGSILPKLASEMLGGDEVFTQDRFANVYNATFYRDMLVKQALRHAAAVYGTNTRDS